MFKLTTPMDERVISKKSYRHATAGQRTCSWLSDWWEMLLVTKQNHTIQSLCIYFCNLWTGFIQEYYSLLVIRDSSRQGLRAE